MSRTLLGSRIRERREAIGLKQIELARASGISAPYLNLIEHNRRGIAGKALIDIAAALGVEVSRLLEGADSALIDKLSIAAAGQDAAVESERVEELVSRYPGWSRLIERQADRALQLEQIIDGLSDRLTHDPFLAESLHEILSSVTAIHATSGILHQNSDMEGLQQRRFQANIFEESNRLSELSHGLVQYFDQQSESEQSLSTPLDEVEAFLDRHGFHFAQLEQNGDAIAALIAQGELTSQSARHMAGEILWQYSRDAVTLPLEAFANAGRQVGFDPGSLAREFSTPLPTIYRRLAFLPADQGLPEFGLITCDGTGAVLLRKPLPGFALPRYGAGCGLWPLYQSMTRPYIPMTANMIATKDQVFSAEAQTVFTDPAAQLPVLRATMIFSALPNRKPTTEENPGHVGPVEVPVGLSCRICEREACAARREISIHGQGGVTSALAKDPVNRP